MALLEDRNQTAVAEFILSVLTDDPVFRVILFIIILCIYLVTVSGNLSTTLLIRVSSQLHHPMYFFLSHLASVDIGLSSSVTPNMLFGFLVMKNTISYLGCGIQLSSAAFFGSVECFLLAAMAYDRFVAICNSLLYSTKMSTQVFTITTLTVIAISYFYILITILKMCSTEGRHKAFSICTSHLTAVPLYYGTLTFICVMPKSSYSSDQNKVLSVFYMVGIPMLNPLIYSLRNSEMKGALNRQIHKQTFIKNNQLFCKT
ncbi:Olfactory receptor 492 [Microtus ochrogaster]|uniref:Olfactory receptor 492 n=1 Tax=Microtus ochrogaster TaxID=79684 RepID=A0A8J6H1G7_MICOH|nr:Olfactory receptor 492 [Microtus ochrogaster]